MVIDSSALVAILLHRAGIEVVPFTGEHAELARVAWRMYGKGRHPARLNIGDCCSYAMAKATGERLLYKGDDFSQTDVGSTLVVGGRGQASEVR